MKILIKKTQNREKSRSGTAAVEAAVCLPILMMLIAGTIEMGLALRVKTVLQSAVRETGRLANIDWRGIVEDDDTPNAKLERDLRNFVTASGFSGSAMTVLIEHEDDAGTTFDLSDPDNELDMVKITASIPYADVGFLSARWIPTPNISASLVMRAGMGGGLSN